MLKIENLSFAYGEVRALRDVELEIPDGQITCVTGRNGVGKSTLMKNIVGLLQPAAGSITLDGRDLVDIPAHRRIHAGLAFVPQGRMIFPKLTVEENLRVGLAARSDRLRKIPDQVFDLFPVLKDMRSRMGGDLSGGQQQQLSIGRALVTDPSLLILDEPTEGIQPNIVQQIGQVLQQLVTDRGMTIVIVEQYLDFIREFSQQFCIMNRGRVVASGETKNLKEEIVKQYLGV
ncbi:MAG TPA: urea ABC transporter ATP-binding subunit UrtE [Lentisphaeria bacterium]|nr:urea ABC transporter ATP-binding subunit UrtE [Lentisphaeria bacterium]|tara:strand:+ start:6117 stop:6812 length:696 start_codon:yes stop_codon:yes gene_type:complete